VAASEGWEDEKRSGEWVKVVRSFRDGHEEEWWALEVDVGSYGSQRARRSVVATTDPQRLAEKATWCLVTNLPHPGSERAKENGLAPADLSEIVRLYGLRMWVEQSYKQVKHVLGWSDYQVRSETLRSAAIGSWLCAHFRSVGGRMGACRPTSQPRRRTILAPNRRRERGKGGGPEYPGHRP
jgi:hypothetical protein